ncbi:hypothetical protein BDN67DRAFT_992059 [Paxillus ammoniavirescens]|nr:hypothetical protein BDN67DRAFT_992059 [Paxillus ammoniavirescens]
MRSHVPPNEAHNDFFGLPSNPLSIYHTGPAWPLPSGPQTQRVPKEARPVCFHAISNVWYELGEKIYTFFDSIDLKWTSIDPVRFAEAEKEPGPLFLWELLLEYAINDVEIAFCESIYTRHAGPQFLDHVSSVDPTADVRVPFTPALGLQIAPKDFPYFEGTSCLYLCKGGESNRVFLLTARHVALPPSKYPNKLYHRKNNSMPRREVIHLGNRAFQDALEGIMDKIGHWESMVDGYEEELTGLGEHVEGEDPNTTSERQQITLKLEEARAFWSAETQRIVGHVADAPPISVGAEVTEDWALVELNCANFNWDAFRGNVIHLGSKLTRYEFMKKMYPHAETRAKFKYPPGGLMHLRAIVTYDELCRGQDANGEACLIVVRNGATTGLTLGRVTGIKSFVREYKDNAIHSTSREIAVYPYSNKGGAFSAPGTPGLLSTDSTDITYVPACASLNERIKQVFPQSYLFPIRNPTQA